MEIFDQIDKAARNAWALFAGDGVEPYSPTPSTVLYDEPHRVLHRFGPADDSRKNPVLLIPPLAAPASCYDLRPSQSLVRFLQETGRTPYLVDYGKIGFDDRGMGFEDWIDDILPQAIRRVSQDNDDADVDLIAWSLGGSLALLTAAAYPELPIRSVSAVTTPFDQHQYPGMNLLRSITRYTRGELLATTMRLSGNIHAPLVQAGFRATALPREIGRPWFVLRNLTNTETLARMEAIDRFTSRLNAYPGRLYIQNWHRLTLRNDLARGQLKLGERTIALSNVKVPTLLIGAKGDAIAPLDTVRGGVAVLSGAPVVRFEVVTGSHLGALTGPDARHSTWAHIESFLDEVAHVPGQPSIRS